MSDEKETTYDAELESLQFCSAEVLMGAIDEDVSLTGGPTLG